MSLSLYDDSLITGRPPSVRFTDGRCETLAIHRWLGGLTRGDESLLRRAPGPVLDIGCGPGRLAVGLSRRGVRAVGIDVARSAVALTRRAGGEALRGSVFGPVPGVGLWETVLLADGNIGIGGAPAALLNRSRELVHPGGRVLVELDDSGHRRHANLHARLEAGGRCGAWFAWACVGVEDIAGVAAEAGLTQAESWSVVETDGRRRHFVHLRRAR